LDATIDLANVRVGKWAEGKDGKLKDAVQTHGNRDWGAIAALVQGRTQKQCLIDGSMSFMSPPTWRMDVRVNGQKMKFSS
jgi:hypothetical protein